MIQLIAGLGKLAVQTKIDENGTNVYLGVLSKKYNPGDTFNEDDLMRQEVQLTFVNEEGLDVLIKALNLCKEHGFRKPLPDELRMGA